MKRYHADEEIDTLEAALMVRMTVDGLRRLARRLTRAKIPTRKSDIAAVIQRRAPRHDIPDIIARNSAIIRDNVLVVSRFGISGRPFVRTRAYVTGV